jgi:exodeoxyribonuclease VIII
MTITNAEYHADPAISASHLHAAAISPHHYWSRYRDPSRPVLQPTAAMRLGSLVHCAVLEPDELSKRYAICGPRNTKAGKEQAAELEAAGIEAVTASDMETAMAMAASVRYGHQAAAELLRTGQAEQSFWWDDKPTGLRCKCRPDWMTGSTLVDLKSTADASPRGFAKSVAQYRYHVQANHYLAGTGAERFVFIAVEKSFPYACAVYELDVDAMLAGENARRRDLSVIADCMAISEWPGYGNTIQPLSLPSWALNPDSTILTSDDF